MSKELVPLFVACDDGSGNIAIAFDDTKGKPFEKYQPSVVEKGVSAGISSGGMSESVWETQDGKHFTVKRFSTSPEDTCYPDYQVSDANRVLVMDTLAKAHLGGAPVVIGCTLPTDQFYLLDNTKNTDRINEKKASLMQPLKNSFGSYEAPDVKQVVVYPEALPAYFYAALDSKGHFKPDYPERHKTIIVDLGQYTNDLALIADGFTVVDFMTGTNGVHKMIDKFHALLQRESKNLNIPNPQGFSKPDLEDIINQGYIGSTLESERAIAARIDITALIKESAAELADLILDDIKKVTQNTITSLTRIVFVGGGANWLAEESQQWHHTVDIPDKPELAIARGTKLLLNNEKPSILASMGMDGDVSNADEEEKEAS